MFGRPLPHFMTLSFPLQTYCFEELSWNFAFELVGRDFLNLDRPCSRHCLCPEHRPLLSCSRHCEQVNVILSFANFEEFYWTRDLRIITLRPLGGEREVAAGTPTKFDIKQVRGNSARWARNSDTLLSSFRIGNCSWICTGWPVRRSW